MLRKQVLGESHITPPQRGAEKDVATLATVLVSSEDPQHPINHVFDHRRGPGGSRWIAGSPGEQTVILAFDTPQTIPHPRVAGMILRCLPRLSAMTRSTR
jgi:hypothetical protein